MDLKDYQKKARKTAIYPNIGHNFIYPTLGLAGEAGEVAEKIKKCIRDNGGILDEDRKKELIKELGDVLWYISNIASEINVSLDKIADQNIKKLHSRQSRRVLHGSGDNR